MTRADGSRPNEGRPSKYTSELAARICEEIALGNSIRTVCKPVDMPAPNTIFKWIREHEEFSKQYAKATEERTEAMSEDLLDIADNSSNDWIEINDPDNPGYRLNGEAIQRARLRVDTRKWLMAKMKPKKYGEKLDLSGETTVTHKYEELDDEQLDAAIKARKDRIAQTD